MVMFSKFEQLEKVSTSMLLTLEGIVKSENKQSENAPFPNFAILFPLNTTSFRFLQPAKTLDLISVMLLGISILFKDMHK